MARLTENGLEWDKFGTVFSKLQSLAEERFEVLLESGEELSTDESSVLGRILAIIADTDSSQEELIYQMYANFDPDQAEGIYLDKLVGMFGIKRKQATPAIAGLILRGSIGVTVPENSVVSNTKTGDRFGTYTNVTFSNQNAVGVVISIDDITVGTVYTLNYRETENLNQYSPISIEAILGDTTESIAQRFAQTIQTVSQVSGMLTSFVDNDDNVHVKFSNFNLTGTFTVSGGCSLVQSYMPVTSVSLSFSAVSQTENDLNVIQTPVLGWLEVYNPFDSVASVDIESDPELRNRFKYTKGYAQTGNREGMYAALYGLSGVRFVNVEENIVDNPVDGRTSHGISVTVLGGDDDDIGRVIDQYRSFAYTDGSVEITRYDINGTPYVVRFNRPEIVPIEIKIGLTTNPNVFPTDGMQRIQDALVFYFSNMNVGQDVFWSQLFNPINTIQGQSVNSLLIGKKGQPLTNNNIVLEHNQLATLSYQDIN